MLLLSLAMLAPLPIMGSSRACADEQQAFCGMPEHVHTGDCYGLILACGQEESAEHSHTEACYVPSETPTCGLTEHVHSLACYSDFTADVEDYDVWCLFSLLPGLTGDWAQDLVKVAEMQLGYVESTRNYIVVDGVKQGYTRYGAWFGQPYDEWCAMFVSFCLNFAQIPKEVMPYDDGTTRMVKKLEERELYRPADGEYTPKPGDLVFFCQSNDEQRRAGHVGIVYKVTGDTLTTIEGNFVPSVRSFEYPLDYELIIGYGEMPENPNKPLPREPAARSRLTIRLTEE